jgi:hypothetical protein
MSITIHKNLSEQEYNNILTASTLNELEAVRDLFLDSISNNNSDTENLNNSLVLIRCLSKEEYDKYLINGTCAGAITKNEINVWHYSEPIKQTGWYVRHADYMLEGPLSKGRSLYCGMTGTTHVCRANGYLVENHFVGYQTVSNVSKTSTIYYNILANNCNNQYTTIGIDDYVFEAMGGYIQYPDRIGAAGSYNVSKIMLINKEVEKVRGAAVGISRTLTESKVTYNVNLDCSYRPVFTYKDNNKSTNIYR